MRVFRIVAHKDPVDCGPPPKPATVGDRYNLAGEMVLYLSETEESARIELEGKTGPKWVREFDVPLDLLNIADFVNVGEREFVNGAFWYAERVKRFEPDTTYEFSQRVAGLVRAHGFGGMLVRGALGEYLNLVIFEPATRWKDWIASPVRAL